ncbi:MAG: hypothetical protein ACI4JK_04905 [Oscillospiraceae bacterium]
MEKEINIRVPEGLLTPIGTRTAVKTTLLLPEKELEQVKAALIHGKRKAVSYLERTKESYKRISREIDITNIDSSLYKAEHCKPKKLYPLDLLPSEVETLIDCLERSGKSKSKDTQQLIDMLYQSLE